MLELIYLEERPLTLERLEYFQTLYEETHGMSHGALIEYLLTEVSKLELKHPVYLGYKETLFNKIVPIINDIDIRAMRTDESVNAMYRIALMLTTDLYELEIPDAEINILSRNIRFNLNKPTHENLRLAIKTIGKLLEHEKLSEKFDYRKLKKFIEWLRAEPRNSLDKVQAIKDDIIELHCRIMLQLSAINGFSSNDVCIKDLFENIYLNRQDAEPQDIIYVLNSIAVHLEHQYALAYMSPNKIIDFIDELLRKVNQLSQKEIVKIKQTLEIFVKAKQLSENEFKNLSELFMALGKRAQKINFELAEIKVEPKLPLNMSVKKRKNFFDEIVNSQKLGFEALYKLVPFLENETPAALIAFALNRLINESYKKEYIKQVFEIIFPVFQESVLTQLENNDPNAIQNIFTSLTRFIDIEVYNEIDEQVIWAIIHFLYTKNDALTTDNLIMTVWTIGKLVEQKKLIIIDSNLIHLFNEMIDNCITRIVLDDKPDLKQVTSMMLTLKRLAEANVIDVDPSSIEILTARFYELFKKANLFHISIGLCALATLIDLGKLQAHYLNDFQIHEIHTYCKANKIILSSFSMPGYQTLDWAFNILSKNEIESEDNIFSKLIYTENLANCFKDMNTTNAKNMDDAKWIITKFIKTKKLDVSSEVVQRFFTDYYAAKSNRESKDAENKTASIELNNNSIPFTVLNVARDISERLKKNTFLRGSIAALAGIDRGSNFHLRLFDLSSDEILVLLDYLTSKNIFFKASYNNFANIEFELEGIDKKKYFLQISLDWKKLSAEESDEAAMLRNLGNDKLNVDSFFILAPRDLTQQLELKGSDYNIANFKDNRISLEDMDYFLKDPVRLFQFVKLSLDFPHLKRDIEVDVALQRFGLKKAVKDFLKNNESKETTDNVERLSNALERLLSHHKIMDMFDKLEEFGIFDTIVNASRLSIADLKITQDSLSYLDKHGHYDKRMGFNYFLLAHFCGSIRHLNAIERKAALDSWQLKEVVMNSRDSSCQDYIIRTILKLETTTNRNPTEPHLLRIVDDVQKYYVSKIKMLNDESFQNQTPCVYSDKNQNPLFAGNISQKNDSLTVHVTHPDQRGQELGIAFSTS